LGADGTIERLVGTIQDVTERKNIESDLIRVRTKLRALSAHQEIRIEEERKHIAREIHDDMGQKLAALQIGLSEIDVQLNGHIGHAEKTGLFMVDRRFDWYSQISPKISELQSIVDDTIDVVRHVATRLRPVVLDFGLVPAIEWLADDFSNRWEIDCQVKIHGEIDFSHPIAATLFRVVQESLTNIAKHASATCVVIALSGTNEAISLQVMDDGHGFDPLVVRQKPGFGLLGMRERVFMLGGTLFIKSAVGEGTRVVINIPLGRHQLQ
jgi:signal transduction histidine kinase